ncbi:MAG: FAD synthase [Candidatus Woesearchaeota archaeon]|nr:FAD synthase [Candidatus Woesearchaeota archaeon]
MVRVLTFGTFDKLHPGHEFHLHTAKEHGDELYVVIARDDTVTSLKGKAPTQTQEERRVAVAALEYVDHAVIGNEGDKLDIVVEIKPDIICLGYDQQSFTEQLQERLAERGLTPSIVKFTDSFHPERYKSSKIDPI